ncbi:hypothetical protein HA402_006353 [Bradysia odoriphaga]|nr:hypothetical protein HA402_006353 [Bradysia odoriphaga]
MKLCQYIISLIWGIFVMHVTSVCCDMPSKDYTAYRLYPYCSPSDYMRYPSNVSDVVAIVNEATSRNVTVKAFGARHSQTDLICTFGIPVDMNKFKSCIMNPDGETASFGPGVTIKEAGEFLLQNGRARRTTPAFGGITIGGAIGTGIVVDVTLKTVPLYKVLATNYIVSDEILSNGIALDWAKTTDQITFYWFPAFKEVVVANLTFVDVNEPGNVYTNAISPPTYGYFNLGGNKAKEIAFDLCTSECALASGLGNTIAHAFEIAAQSSLVRDTPGFVPIYTENGNTVKNPAVGFPHLMFAASCSEASAGLGGPSCFWAHGDINSNMTILDNDGKSDAHMATNYGMDTAHVEFALWKRTDSYNKASGNLA